ncbi:MAG: hypothetical protein ACK4RN_01810 [Pseudorhodobacter sp.]
MKHLRMNHAIAGAGSFRQSGSHCPGYVIEIIGLMELPLPGGLLLDGSANDDNDDAPLPEPEPGTDPTDGPDLLTGTEGMT